MLRNVLLLTVIMNFVGVENLIAEKPSDIEEKITICLEGSSSLYDPERITEHKKISDIHVLNVLSDCKIALLSDPENVQLKASVAYLELGLGNGGSYATAIRLASEAARMDSAYGLAILGIMQTTPESPNFSPTQGTTSLLSSVDKGSDGAYLEISEFLSDKKYRNNFSFEVFNNWVSDVGNERKPKARSLKGICHLHGIYCEKDIEESYRNLKLSSMRGDVLANYYLIFSILENWQELRNENRTTFNMVWNSIRFFDVAGEGGTGWAKSLFVDIFIRVLSELEFESEIEQSRIAFMVKETLEKMALHGNEIALKGLVSVLFCGVGGQKDPVEAILLIEEYSSISTITTSDLNNDLCSEI